MSNALHAYSTTLSFDPAGGTSYAVVVEVIKITGPNISLTNTKVTNLASPNAAQEYKPGLIEGGELTFDINATKVQVNTFYANLRVPLMHWLLQWPLFGSETVPTQWDFFGHISGMGAEYPDDDRITVPVTVKVSGKPIFTQGH